MENVKNIIIGFGKAGKTLAGFLSSKGENVVLVEKDKGMYGGTCINVGCIPSKFISNKAGLRSLSELEKKEYYEETILAKNNLISMLNEANYKKIASLPNVEVADGVASFINKNTVAVKNGDGIREIQAERIFINTGMTPVLPKIKGLALSDRILTSETIMAKKELPETLAVIGSGYIGLEFASSYSLLGAEVTVIGDMDSLMPREDEDVENLVKAALEEQGIRFVLSAGITELLEDEGGVEIRYSVGGSEHSLKVSHVLVATGRRPNTEDLQLENAGVEVGSRGEILVNDRLETNVEGIYALGDVHGGLQFTYLSLDDFRIIKNTLFGDGSYDLTARKFVPYNVFINPSFARVGLNEKEAQAKGIEYRLAKMPVNMIPKAKILGKQTGLFKVLIEKEGNKILGANLYGVDSHEIINLFVLAMNEGISYESLRDQIYTHPTIGESINELLATVQ